MDTGPAYDLIVTLIKFNLELRDRVWPCSAIACLTLFCKIFGFRTFIFAFSGHLEPILALSRHFSSWAIFWVMVGHKKFIIFTLIDRYLLFCKIVGFLTLFILGFLSLFVVVVVGLWQNLSRHNCTQKLHWCDSFIRSLLMLFLIKLSQPSSNTLLLLLFISKNLNL